MRAEIGGDHMNASVVGGMPDSGLGTLPFDEVTALVREIEAGAAWQKAVTTLHLPTLSRKGHWFTNPKKALFYLSLTTPTRGLALDVGAGSGVIASELARHFRRVIAVEPDAKWSRFMTHRFSQDGLAVDVIHGNAFQLPGTVANVDLAVVNGVLEWAAFGDTPEAKAGTPRDVQLAFLRAIRSALRPGGRIGIAIENRLHFDCFRGASPHDELPYVAVMPRPLAEAVTRRRQGVSYRTWIYGARGYRRLLQDAGFSRPQIYAALPTYHQPESFVPLDRTDAIRPHLINGSRLRRVALTAIAAAGLLGQMVHSFYIAAEAPER
jgi:SAM-dependent methyltransferase